MKRNQLNGLWHGKDSPPKIEISVRLGVLDDKKAKMTTIYYSKDGIIHLIRRLHLTVLLLLIAYYEIIFLWTNLIIYFTKLSFSEPTKVNL